MVTPGRSRFHPMDPSKSFITTALLLALTSLFSPALCCGVIPGFNFTIMSMEDTFSQGPVALTGKVINLDEVTNLGRFQVYCVFKWDAGDDVEVVPDEINVFEAVYPNSCSTRTLMALGEIWLMSLKRGADGKFTFYEPHINNGAAYQATLENMQTVADISDEMVQDKVPSGVTFNCPVNSVTTVTTETTVTTDTTYLSGSVGLTPVWITVHFLQATLCLAALVGLL